MQPRPSDAAKPQTVQIELDRLQLPQISFSNSPAKPRQTGPQRCITAHHTSSVKAPSFVPRIPRSQLQPYNHSRRRSRSKTQGPERRRERETKRMERGDANTSQQLDQENCQRRGKAHPTVPYQLQRAIEAQTRGAQREPVLSVKLRRSRRKGDEEQVFPHVKSQHTPSLAPRGTRARRCA